MKQSLIAETPSQDSLPANTLKRSLKTRHLNMISIGGALGTGLFLASGASISTAGPGGALLAYSILGIMIYFIMTSLGEMAAYPLAFRASKLDKAFTIYLMIGFLVPFQAILLSLFEVMQTLHLIDSVAGMAGKVVELLGNETMMEKQENLGFQRYKDYFTAKRVSDDYRKLLLSSC